MIIRKKTDKIETLDVIRNKIKEIDKQNLIKTLDQKINSNQNLSPKSSINVRWNPLLQDWVPLEKYNETIESALQSKK